MLILGPVNGMRSFRKHLNRLTRAMLCLGAFLGAAPPHATAQSNLTTIQDTLFSADGTRFNGSLTISWSTFDASGLGTVVQQSKTVRVSNGNLYVQLAPNVAAAPPANIYTVFYQSDGYQQFTETWTVPAVSSPLAVSQVRIGTSAGNSTNGGVSASNSTPITESAIIGLATDLQQRPVKGAAYASGAVAVIDQNGQLEAAAGAPGSCVMVDGTTGPCGGSGPSFIDAEIPGGAANGTNRVFTLQNSPSGGSLMLFRNGMYMLAGFDYTLTGSTIQFVPAAIPQSGDTLAASYRLASTSAVSSTGGTSSSSVTLATSQVICSGVGSSTSAASMTDLGGCTLPAASLQAGNRIEIRFTFSHSGFSSGFGFETDWGAAAILSRQASAADIAAAGSADSGIGASAAQISYQSWGSALALSAGIQNTSALTGIRVGFKAMLANAGTDSVSLASYTVLLYPAN
jgi:hypothetical protein